MSIHFCVFPMKIYLSPDQKIIILSYRSVYFWLVVRFSFVIHLKQCLKYHSRQRLRFISFFECLVPTSFIVKIIASPLNYFNASIEF